MKKYASIFVIFFLTIAFLSQSCYAQDGADRFLHWLKDDPVSMFTDIGQNQLYTMASLGVGVSAISLGDHASSIYFQDEYGRSDVLDFTNHWGDWRIAGAASAGIFATSLITRNTKFQDAAFTSLQALLMTNLTVNAAKFVFGRERPIHQEGPYDFDFVEMGSTSFPSGHTATAFALITPWVIYFPGPITYSLMAIP
ncbi:MAG: phosphatase PAP2 family protein, partial [Balneolaceae bacterium]|nr:phosphatase PAP2 family protein [Balneolaceae bacterium]